MKACDGASAKARSILDPIKSLRQNQQLYLTEEITMIPNDYVVGMDALASLCKRRGFIFQTSEIYGGINGFWDYGPLGVELKRNIKDCWWKSMTMLREDIVGLDSSIIMHPRVWEASGHVGGFKDPMCDCRETKGRYRADQIKVMKHKADADALMFAFPEDEPAIGEKIKSAKLISQIMKFSLLDIPVKNFDKIVAPDTNTTGTLTEPRAFNLMFKTFVGRLKRAQMLHIYARNSARNFCSIWQRDVSGSQ